MTSEKAYLRIKCVLAVALLLYCDRLPAKVAWIHTEDSLEEYRGTIRKGLDWMVQQQFDDGHFEAKGRVHITTEQYPVAMTALCGMAFLMEDSTLSEGRYSKCLGKAVDWLVDHSMLNGLLGGKFNTEHLNAERYMYGHGFSLLFLSCVYGEENEVDLRNKLEGILTQAVAFTGRAQCSNGGWGYLSSMDTNDGSEGSVTITQMQALRAARNAGIAVPKEILDRGIAFLRSSTTREGGVIYMPGHSKPQLSLTAAAVVCGFSAGEYGSSDIVKRWIKFCQLRVNKLGLAADAEQITGIGHDEYTHLYLSQLTQRSDRLRTKTFHAEVDWILRTFGICRSFYHSIPPDSGCNSFRRASLGSRDVHCNDDQEFLELIH